VTQHLTPADTAISPKSQRQKSFHETIEVTEIQYLDMVDDDTEHEEEDQRIEKIVGTDSLFDYGAGWNETTTTTSNLSQRKR
jgi:hypothetical protein